MEMRPETEDWGQDTWTVGTDTAAARSRQMIRRLPNKAVLTITFLNWDVEWTQCSHGRKAKQVIMKRHFISGQPGHVSVEKDICACRIMTASGLPDRSNYKL